MIREFTRFREAGRCREDSAKEGSRRFAPGAAVAGTLVVKAPAAVLLSDLTDRAPARRSRQKPFELPPPPPAEEFPFTREQLDIYGIHELQVPGSADAEPR